MIVREAKRKNMSFAVTNRKTSAYEQEKPRGVRGASLLYLGLNAVLLEEG